MTTQIEPAQLEAMRTSEQANIKSFQFMPMKVS